MVRLSCDLGALAASTRRADGIFDSPLSDIAAIGNHFAATYGAFMVTGEVDGDTLRFVDAS